MLRFRTSFAPAAGLAVLVALAFPADVLPQRPGQRPAGEDQKVQLDRRLLVDRTFDDTPLRQALHELAHEHDVSMVFGVEPGTEPVSAHFARTSAFDAAQALLVAAGYRFEVRSGAILWVRGKPQQRTDAATAAAQPADSVKPGINETFLDPELDVDRFVQRFEGESREIFAHRTRLAAALDLEPGMEVADVGAGTGLFMDLFARGVGEQGKVYAVELSPKFLEHLRQRVEQRGHDQVEVVKCTEDSVELPAESVDRVFICDTYHHFEYPARTMASVRRALRPGGELLVVDFNRIPGISRDWLLGHVRAGRDAVCAEIAGFGFEFVEFVPVRGLRENYVVRFRRPAE